MKISACYITKNESANIAASIESIEASVDEIIVCDTGSEDDTCRIAEALPKVKLFRGATSRAFLNFMPNTPSIWHEI